ncbi:hypothetical protein L2E82_36177 [Cichorium intybus]|uniref:Uncharacterized protein n=1 Tax=Cichorium intybus TaxID=13427 RepID=A0ACB9BR40_CICIN|nr:hypothetical protein L2E82_36177 [Cichorium intybus]
MEKVVEDDELDPDGKRIKLGIHLHWDQECLWRSLRCSITINKFGSGISLCKNQEGDPGTDGSDMEEGGTLWDVFRMEDTSKLEEYLKKHFKDFRDVFCRPLQPIEKDSSDQEKYWWWCKWLIVWWCRWRRFELLKTPNQEWKLEQELPNTT